MRDYQRARVYRAEEYLDVDRFLEFSSIRECNEYAEIVWSNPKIRARFPKACKLEKPHIRESRSKVNSHAFLPPEHTIALSKVGGDLTDYAIIHELAHIITENEFTKNDDWILHGPQWVDVLLFLVKTMLGNQFYDDLVEAFLMEGVDFTRNK